MLRQLGWSLILTAALVAGSSARAQLVERTGVARFYNVDEATVVYAASGGAQARIAAERAADELRFRHGVIAEVRADDALEAERREGHLLALGWEVDLWSEAAPRPFERVEGRVRFGDVAPLDARDDFVMLHVSPFNLQRYLLFWSRTDLEISRFYALPFVGSDWAAFRDWMPYRRGQIEQEATWPPRPIPEAEIRKPVVRPPAVRRIGPLAIHHLENEVTDEELGRIVAARGRALEAAIERLGSPGRDFTVDLYLYPDADIKRERTGVPDDVHDVAVRGELHMTRQAAVHPSAHEEIQLLARHLYGGCNYTAINEGLSIAALADDAVRHQLRLFANHALERDSWPPIDRLLDERGLADLVSEGVGYPFAAMLVSWLRERLPAEGFAELFTAVELDAAAIAERVGIEGDPDDTFRAWAREFAAAGEEAYAVESVRIEAREAQQRGDAAGEAQALARLLEVGDDDPAVRYALGDAQRRAGRIEAAIATFAALADSEASEGHRARAALAIGVIRWDRGELEAADAQFRRVLEMPDAEGSHDLATESLAEIRAELEAGD